MMQVGDNSAACSSETDCTFPKAARVVAPALSIFRLLPTRTYHNDHKHLRSQKHTHTHHTKERTTQACACGTPWHRRKQ